MAKQLNPFSLLFHIKRHSGESPAQDFPLIGGDTIRVTHHGLELPRPKISILSTATNTEINFTARSFEEAKRIIAGFKGKFPNLDVETALAAGQSTYSYVTAPIAMTLAIGGPDAGRSIVKSALALAVASGVNAAECQDARRYLASGENPCFGYFSEYDLMHNRPDNTVIHCVAVQSTDGGLLLGYVELFNCFRAVVCLSSKYTGKRVHTVYAVDPVNGSELSVSVSLKFTQQDLTDIYAYERVSQGAVAQALSEVIPDALNRAFEREKQRVIKRAVEKAWVELKAEPGTQITREHVAKLSKVIIEELRPFISRFHAS